MYLLAVIPFEGKEPQTQSSADSYCLKGTDDTEVY